MLDLFRSQYLLLIILVVSFIFIKYYLKNKSLLLYFSLLLITPWFWTLFFGEPPVSHLINIDKEGLSILANLEIIWSYKYLFFEGDPTLFYIVGEHGYFLLSFLSLIITGIWVSLNSSQLNYRRLVLLLIIGLILSAFLFNLAGLLTVFLFLPLLSLFATFGLLKFLKSLRVSKNNLVRALIAANFLLISYEAVRLFRIMQVQFGILNQ